MGVALWKDEVGFKREEVTVRFEESRPVALSGKTFYSLVNLIRKPTAFANATAWA